jgi:hypothetical protein
MKNEKLVSLKRRGKTVISLRKQRTRSVGLRRCGTSRHIFHLVRQSSLWNSERRDKGSCFGQTGASFQNSSVATRCQNSQKGRMTGLLNHIQGRRPFGDKLVITQDTLLVFMKPLYRERSLFGQNPNFNIQCSLKLFVVHLRPCS